MKHQTGKVRPVIRPRWRGDDAQESALAAIAAKFEESRKAEDAGWAAVRQARELGVPDTVICQRADISRTTLQRKLGHRPDADEASE
ncbi:hypothetical protein [Actinoplanes palleronii]|uniref:Helix-turn-helix DNA binding domain protein n=1 Tax=Actinoplanes palleronii TaxID=113570 RepID=A0ABQ4BJA5_9ACTN|nr:hypothetical protein [Actinoplanes palleronii]GIE70710.1 hypothetical protein Apa02nite_068180 [Actinoplanes palleronii]